VPLRRVFALTSVLFLAVLAVSPAKNALRPYRSFQARYRKLGMTRARSLKAAEEYRAQAAAVRQIWIPEFDDRVDRCTTCHLGVADALMTGADEPFRLHTSTVHTPGDFDRFGCTSCHGGQGPATSEAEAHGTAPEAGPPMTPLPSIEAGCGRCHVGEEVPEAPILSRGRALMSRSGCYACHAVRGHEGFRSEAPPLATLSLKTGGAWVRRWLAGPKEIDPNATMPNFNLSAQEIEALTHYLFGLPAPAGLEARVSAAAAEPAGDAGQGKKLFSESRCISCHTVEGKGNGSAPELSRVGSAANRGWLLAFVRDPHAFNPATRMPRYDFTPAESRDLVQYLVEELKDFDAPPGLLDPLRVNQTQAETGARIFRQYGCFACHGGQGGAPAEKFGPELDGIGDKRAASLDFGRRPDLPRTLPAWLQAKIAAPRSFAPGLKMPSFGFEPEDARAVVTALLALGAQPVPESYRFAPPLSEAPVPAGPVGAMLDSYRCMSCHRIGDRGGDLSTAPLTREGSRVRRAWLVDYLVLPYTLRPILEERMPVLKMDRQEAERIADLIETFYLDPAIPDDPFAGRPSSDADATEGGRLYVTLGCRACHILGASGGYVGPPLTEAAKRLKPGWVFTWLKGPQRWRPDVRCPDYGLTDTDALRLTAFLEVPRVAAGGAARAAP
jgi:mono/diheme cytochrome c family protein